MQFFTSSPVKALVIGAAGQIGQELTIALRDQLGAEQVIATDIRPLTDSSGPSLVLDVTDQAALQDAVEAHQIDHIYNLAAILSAKGEQNPQLAWDLNMKGLLNSLEVVKN
ncbi:MAG: NAD-dependent epimerase/dehydratase family protein, partial [Bacteroidota bacterium]